MLAYWHGDTAVAVMDIDSLVQDQHIIGHALLNGKQIRVVWDSGAGRSILTREAAERAGVHLDDQGVVAAGLGHGVAQRRTETWTARFDSLDLGGERINNIKLQVGDIELMFGDMLLGADFFLSHRIFVSRSQRKIFFTYNGGSVFDLRDTSVANKAVDASTPDREPLANAAQTGQSDSPDTSSQSNQSSVADMKRHAMAAGARHEFALAISEFDAIIKLDAGDADNYLQRGLLYMANQQPLLALNDFDQAISLKPELAQAHMERGVLRLARGNTTGAREDFDAAERVATDPASVQLNIAHAYLGQGKFEESIAYFDAWIAANPKDDQLPFSLTQRCRARAMANKQLDIALIDCNAALRKVSRDSGMLDNRALVYLRLGSYEKAVDDYKASLKLQPKSAWTLYGLGLAQMHTKSAADSEKTIAAAVAMSPQVANAYRSLGLVPPQMGN
jgi:tetratricopeptide (TPR) repeat protein